MCDEYGTHTYACTHTHIKYIHIYMYMNMCQKINMCVSDSYVRATDSGNGRPLPDTHAYVYTHTYLYIYTYICIPLHVCVWKWICVYVIHGYVYGHEFVCMLFTYMCMNMNMCVCCLHICVWTWICVYVTQTCAEQIRATVDDYEGMIPTVLEIPSKDNPYDPNKVSGGSLKL